MKKTSRGFRIFSFKDRYGQDCSLQESSLAEEGAIWLGVDNTGPHINGPDGTRNSQVSARMHLTQEQVKELLPLLTYFTEYGDLPESGED